MRLRDTATAGSLITAAALLDLPDLRAKIEELCAALAPDDSDQALADARDSAELRLRHVGANLEMCGQCDRVSGELLEQVLTALAEQLRGRDEQRSMGQHLMDALTQLARTAPVSGQVPADTLLTVITTVQDLTALCQDQPEQVDPVNALGAFLDTLTPGTPVAEGATGTAEGVGTRQAAGTSQAAGSSATAGTRRWTTCARGGLPLGPRSLAALTCTSRLTRLLLDDAGHPLDSGPTRRQLLDRERRALEHQAGYHCQRRGCDRPAHACVPHRVVPWALGGPSTLATLVLLCLSCHHTLHDRARPLTLTLTTGHRIGPRGWLDHAPDGGPPPAPF